MKHQTKAMTLCALFAALTAVCAQISIPLPGGVPLSLSVAAVYLTGLQLAPGWAAASQVVYLLLGAFGMPVYAGFSSGMGVLFGPTGGYLFVYPLMALAVSLGVRRWGKGWAPAAGSMLAALALCYVAGTLWYAAVGGVTLWQAAAVCVLPFVPVDLVKIPLAIAVGSRLDLHGRQAQRQADRN